ncbi:hypothetical protein Poli38472_004329 [Pythium oligandrum]|uniref:Uncharacterized protein n=1 Tax=Pythium oligandrum TaxID=41045 RepID=A0A8K1CA15_PYTOL|nr:hypothetical protein Poli38472_004329 [Pythium oligandrum]|eukprot:TMW59260.1 hypothetical protein Poli38472_004329 [Pythium oligandrum]
MVIHGMLRLGACGGVRRAFSTSKKPSAINLTPFVSPLLLRLHPDRLQRHSTALAQDNEEALKQLNQFLEIATFGCNNNGYRARKQVLSLAEDHHDDPNAPIRLPLRFHIQTDTTGDESEFHEVDHVIEVPGTLVRRTLAHGTRDATKNLSDALKTPFAREWQRTTKRILKDLFHIAHIPLYNNNDDEEEQGSKGTPTQLALWIEEDDTEEARRGRGVAAHNASAHRMHTEFDSMFQQMLAREKNVVHATTTGLEDGSTLQHAVLTRLVSQRVFLEKIPEPEEKRRVFFWLANLLLMNFMELRLHSLVWNKVMLMLTTDASLETPQVLWESERPERGMAVLIPAYMDNYALVDVLYEHVENLELALNHKAERQARHAARRQSQQQAKEQRHKKKRHFYSDEVAEMFRRR